MYDRWCKPDTLFVFNAHFDHVGKLARKKSAELLRAQMAGIAGDHPLILMGDFNTTPWSLAFRRLIRQTGLRNAAAGFGYLATWPVNRPITV